MKIKIFAHLTGYLLSQHWFTASLPHLIHKGGKLGYLQNRIADGIFYWEKEDDEYLFQI